MLENENVLDNMQYPVKKAAATLVLGILAIVSCVLYGIPSIILGIIALSISSNSKSEYLADPSQYDRSSYNQLNAGRVCAIVGISLSVLFWIILVIFINIIKTKLIHRGF